MDQQFDVVVERELAGYFVASMPALPGCHTQAKSLDKLMARAQEGIELCLSEYNHPPRAPRFLRGAANHFTCMTALPALTGKKCIAALYRSGFVVARIHGSHHYLRHEDGRCTVVPVHSGETVGPGRLAKNPA